MASNKDNQKVDTDDDNLGNETISKSDSREKENKLKNVSKDSGNVGYIAISENSLDIKAAIEERKNFILRTAILVAIVILIFSIVLNKYFLKPIKSLVDYTKIIKSKSKKQTKIDHIKNFYENDIRFLEQF